MDVKIGLLPYGKNTDCGCLRTRCRGEHLDGSNRRMETITWWRDS